jgi:3-oxoacyl-[acyl-carrier protein] reductase
VDLQLSGSTALITGGSKGIGRATAQAFLAEGARVILVARDADRLAATAAELTGAGSPDDATTIAADLSTAEGIRTVEQAAGPIDVLVNNAGAIPGGRLTQVDDARWREAWDLKVFGYLNLTRALYPRLVESNGVVVNVIGAAGEIAPPEYTAGAAGNAALMAFTRSLAKTSRLDGVRVVGINPGLVLTERMASLLGEDADSKTRGMPFGRPAHPHEIADAVVFLASPRSSYTNGAILTIDGAPTEVL